MLLVFIKIDDGNSNINYIVKKKYSVFSMC